MRSVPVYVGSKFENKEAVRQVMAALKARGHTITFDWTVRDSTGKTGRELWEYQTEGAELDADGVAACEVFFFLDHPACKGGYSELGMAAILDKKVLVIDGVLNERGAFQNIFMHLPEVLHLDSVEDGLDHVDLHAAATQAPGLVELPLGLRPNMAEARA